MWSEEKRADIEFCVVNELPALMWAVNIGSLELHTSLHLRDELHRPTVIAFDLDPGPGADLLDCCEVALRLRWEEIEHALDAADPRRLVFDHTDVLERIAQHGDLFADVLTLVQEPA